MRFIRDGDTLGVHSMDRLARNLDDLRSLVQKLTRKGVRIEFLKENLTFTGEDAPGKPDAFGVVGAFAELERAHSYRVGILRDFVVSSSFSFNEYMPPVWSLRPSLPSDASWIAELRAQVMRPDLERLGRWDPVHVRERFVTGFHPAHTFVIEVEASAVGVIAVRPESDEKWIEHFYLAPEYQGQGLGGAVLRQVLMAQHDHRPFRLNVLQGSPARRLYERNGFVHEHEDSIDVFLVAETDQKFVPRTTCSL